MTNTTDAACVAANASGLPDDTRRLIEIEDAIAKIRTQIATADLARQRTARPIDPDWFHRARTALRHLNRERAEIVARQGGRRRREQPLRGPRRRHLPLRRDAALQDQRQRHGAHAWAASAERDHGNPRLSRRNLRDPCLARHRHLAADHGAAHRERYRRAAGVFRVADGYFAADHTSFWGCKVG